MSKRPFAMKTSLGHLPAPRIAWIAQAADIIRKFADVEMIILYGSYARGDYVEDPVGTNIDDQGGPNAYFSDLDLCVLTRGVKIARRIERSSELKEKLTRADGKLGPQLIAHSVSFFNRKLENGEFFFVDIAKEGVLLYDSGNYRMSHPKNLTDEQRRQKQERDYTFWKGLGDDFVESATFDKQREKFSISAFHLHQAAEHYLAAAALILSGYRPHGHDLARLEKYCAQFDKRFHHILPRSEPEDLRLFKLLQDAYTKSRYSSQFNIELHELAILEEHVNVLRDKVETLKLCSIGDRPDHLQSTLVNTKRIQS